MPEQDEVTLDSIAAYHEAGHAVAAVLLGIEFARASVQRGEDSVGRATQRRLLEGSADSSRHEDLMVVLFAGVRADEKYVEVDAEGGDGDSAAIYEFLRGTLGLSHEETAAPYMELWKRANALIEDAWPHIREVAARIEADSEIGDQDVKRIVFG